MLVLRRYVGQGFKLIDPVSGIVTTVTAEWDSGNRIKMAIDAPKEVKIIKSDKEGVYDAHKQSA